MHHIWAERGYLKAEIESFQRRSLKILGLSSDHLPYILVPRRNNITLQEFKRIMDEDTLILAQP
jgi:hypothetical protein